MQCTIRTILIASLIVLSSIAHALPIEQLKHVSDAVVSICRGGSLNGASDSIEVVLEGNTQVVILKKLAELGVNGRARISKEEWSGIKAMANERLFHECVQKTLPLLLFSLENDTRKKTKGPTLGDNGFGGGGKYYFRENFRPLYKNRLFQAALSGFAFAKDSSKITVELTSLYEGTLYLRIDTSLETSLIDDRGGLCVDTNKFIDIHGITGDPGRYTPGTPLEKGDIISFSISDLRCSSSIIGNKVSINIPYYYHAYGARLNRMKNSGAGVILYSGIKLN